jgi:NADP-reducing hydrogenase subunit HndB
MPRLNNVEDLTQLRESLQEQYDALKASDVIITIGMGTCGQAAGAGDTYQAFQKEIEKRNLPVTLRSVGCIGMCVMEPLVDIQLADQPRVTYVNVRPSQVGRIIDEHVLQGRVIHEWAIGFVPVDW